MVIDVQAPPQEQKARLRIWAIETYKDEADNERFNNIQLSYSLDYDQARKIVEQVNSPSLDDLANLLHDTNNHLNSMIISDQTGQDKNLNLQMGRRYEFDADERQRSA